MQTIQIRLYIRAFNTQLHSGQHVANLWGTRLSRVIKLGSNLRSGTSKVRPRSFTKISLVTQRHIRTQTDLTLRGHRVVSSLTDSIFLDSNILQQKLSSHSLFSGQGMRLP
ncbi:uncharacterized protein LOC127876131 [Dreissena polymorpha]|uniref:uncharacterized protein LOC127876131 n=1 Tax=Dreissena polymorpha TaxID=45954 RepID=UPI0022642CC4|nr:uncharacterized protein LOC127876131 [Dreissena polymorpha]